ncbi:FecR family protein [Fodinibius salsisoli]|uniref:FecR family protein n=1 Tax=Fodinibius salsisoli TaxID=2820877 RepID=A0ABT3PP08_9BACT|nr:FecR domain-containing protein [Fodinibius salsisoli]MCW9707584.1 FecR family protein [Fodinibius salsisoli]
MDQRLLDKYFRDECSDEELDQVLGWFQTEEGRTFLAQEMEEEFENALETPHEFGCYPADSEHIFNRIQLQKRKYPDTNHRFSIGIRVASILLILVGISAFFYLEGYLSFGSENPQPKTITYVTQQGQQHIFTLSDGTKIRLNEQSQLKVPTKMQEGKRNVNLKGEAYFEVARNTDHPFIVNTEGSTIEVLGTKFNVNTDSTQNCVEVAVIEGKVALKQKGDGSSGGALLTRNNFGLLHLGDGQITIEKVNAKNYLSWIYNRLVYSGETLEQVSRQIEHLYNVEVEFKSRKLRKLKLTANIEKTDLSEVLDVIAKTFNITYQKRENGKIVWMT